MKRSDTLSQTLASTRERTSITGKKFPFIGAGRSRAGKQVIVSERHDEALALILIGKKTAKGR
jgi:hypothetical protein